METNNKQIPILLIFLNFFSALLLITLSVAFTVLSFQIINYLFPINLINYSYDLISYASIIRNSLATIFVVAPLYFASMYFWFYYFRINQDIKESKITKWTTYIILFFSLVAIIADLITVITYFLEGDFTVRFLLKSLVVLILAGLIFTFYFFERSKIQYEKKIKPFILTSISIVVGTLLLLSIFMGFYVTGSPITARKEKNDRERIYMLQNIQSSIIMYFERNQKLPNSLGDLVGNLKDIPFTSIIINDPVTNEEFKYEVIINNGLESRYKLCANFEAESRATELTKPIMGWDFHKIGEHCEDFGIYVSGSEFPLRPIQEKF